MRFPSFQPENTPPHEVQPLQSESTLTERQKAIQALQEKLRNPSTSLSVRIKTKEVLINLLEKESIDTHGDLVDSKDYLHFSDSPESALEIDSHNPSSAANQSNMQDKKQA